MRPDPRAVVRAGYDAIGPRYHEWSRRSPVRLRFLHELLERVPAGSTVVDLGCGPGDPATRLLSLENRVIGVDLSAAQLRIARGLAPDAVFVLADLRDVAFASGSVDAVASFYALGHLPAEQHAPLFRSVAGWLRPGGVLVTSAPLVAGDGIEGDWLGVPMFFGGIGEVATLRAVADAGLVVESAERVPEDEGDGKIVEFLWVTATKPLS